MEFKQLASFVQVVRYHSFTKAAEKLQIAQPTISTHVQMLEEEMQAQLLIRTTRAIDVTPQGRELFEFAERVLDLRDDLLRNWSQTQKTTLTIGASTIPAAYILPRLLPAYLEDHPDARLSVQQDDSRAIIEGMHRGLYDIGIVGMPADDSTLVCRPLCKERMVLITPSRLPYTAWKSSGRVPVDELAVSPFILREEGSGSRQSAARILREMGIKEDTLTVTARVDGQDAMRNLVACGLGVALISAQAVEEDVTAGRILQFDLDAAGEREFYILCRIGAGQKEQALEFRNFALAWGNT